MIKAEASPPQRRGSCMNLCMDYLLLWAPFILQLDFVTLSVAMPPSRGYNRVYHRGRTPPPPPQPNPSTSHNSNPEPNSPRVQIDAKVITQEYWEQIPHHSQEEIENVEEEIVWTNATYMNRKLKLT
jgi:hypothetical protein